MNAEQVGGIIRTVLGIGGSYAIAKGYVTVGNWEWITTGALGLIVGGWSWWAKRPSA